MLVICLALPAYVRASSPDEAAVARYASCDSVISRFSVRPLAPLEGIWRFSATGAIVAIEMDHLSPVGNFQDTYTVTIIESARRSVMPGTVMGHIVPAAGAGIYHASLCTDFDGGSRLFRIRKFSLRLTDDSHLAFKPLGWQVRMQIWRVIPYLNRFPVKSVTRDRDDAYDGCVRIYPRSGAVPVIPVYL